MTVMVNSMDKSYTEQGTNCDEAISFMDTHNLNGRSELVTDEIQCCKGLHFVDTFIDQLADPGLNSSLLQMYTFPICFTPVMQSFIVVTK